MASRHGVRQTILTGQLQTHSAVLGFSGGYIGSYGVMATSTRKGDCFFGVYHGLMVYTRADSIFEDRCEQAEGYIHENDGEDATRKSDWN